MRGLSATFGGEVVIVLSAFALLAFAIGYSSGSPVTWRQANGALISDGQRFQIDFQFCLREAADADPVTDSAELRHRIACMEQRGYLAVPQ